MHSFRSYFADAVVRALFLPRTKLKWHESEKRDRDGDRNFRRSRFRPFPGGFMSFAVANDFAFPNEDIRWGSIRRMTVRLGENRISPDQRRDPSGTMPRMEKKYWRSFSFLDADPNFISSFPHRWRSNGKRSSTSTDLLRVFLLIVLMALFIRVLIWLLIKPNIPLDCDFWI